MPLNPLIDSVICDLGFDFEMGWMVEIEPAMHLPPCVLPKTRAMAWMRRTGGLALMPVPHVMRADHSERSRHPNQRTKPDEYVLQPLGRLESFVNEEPVHAYGMPCANSDRRGCQEYKEPAPTRRPDDREETAREHQEEPNRLLRVPANGALDGVCLAFGMYTIC